MKVLKHLVESSWLKRIKNHWSDYRWKRKRAKQHRVAQPKVAKNKQIQAQAPQHKHSTIDWPRYQKHGLAALYIGLFLVFVHLSQQLWLSGQRGYQEVKNLQVAVAEHQAKNARLLTRNEILRHEVMSLKNGADALEERARAELGMIRPGETLIQLLPEK